MNIRCNPHVDCQKVHNARSIRRMALLMPHHCTQLDQTLFCLQVEPNPNMLSPPPSSLSPFSGGWATACGCVPGSALKNTRMPVSYDRKCHKM